MVIIVGNTIIGKETDHESSLGDFGARKYDTELGRFTSVDPLWESSVAMSPYAYCGNNPISGTDRSGKISKTLILSQWTDSEFQSMCDNFIADCNAWIHQVCLQQEQRNKVNDMNEKSQALGLGVEFNIVNGNIVGSMNINIEHQSNTWDCAYKCAMALAKWFHTDQANYTENQLVSYIDGLVDNYNNHVTNPEDKIIRSNKDHGCPLMFIQALFNYVGLDYESINGNISSIPNYINAGIPILAIGDIGNLNGHICIINGYNYDDNGNLYGTLTNAATLTQFGYLNDQNQQSEFRSIMAGRIPNSYISTYYFFSIMKH
jgi:RHS repeat-associated protein